MRYTSSLLFLAVLGAVVAPLSDASGNGMDMSMDDAINLAQGEMLSYLHFTPGDILWFQGWVPSSSGAMVGTCIGLFLLALVQRWIAAGRAVANLHWSSRAYLLQSYSQHNATLPVTTHDDDKKITSMSLSPVPILDGETLRTFPPFIFAHDIPRGILFMTQAALSYAFMLVVMTFQLGFIFALLVGLGVGEALFGRFASHTTHLA